MIEQVHFTNFKSLRDVTVDLAPFTLIVGANGSGKSSVLQGMFTLQGTVRALEERGTVPVAGIFRGTDAIGRLCTAGQHHLSLVVDGSPFGRFALNADARGEPALTLSSEDPDGRVELHFDVDLQADPAEAYDFGQWMSMSGLGSVEYLDLVPTAAAAPHYSDEAHAVLEFDGTGLPSVIQRLQLLRDGRFEAIEAALTRVVPNIKRIRAVPHKVKRTEATHVTIDKSERWIENERERTGARIEADIVGGGWVAADLLSEGTILTLALLTVLHDEAPRTLLLDDLDQALHPTAQKRLMGEIRQLQKDRPEVQIVATTHSPFLVDCAAVEEVRVIRLDEHGASHCQPLAAHPKWAKRSGFMKPGEFWAGVGEDWVGL